MSQSTDLFYPGLEREGPHGLNEALRDRERHAEKIVRRRFELLGVTAPQVLQEEIKEMTEAISCPDIWPTR